jgi:hypothetical protein
MRTRDGFFVLGLGDLVVCHSGQCYCIILVTGFCDPSQVSNFAVNLTVCSWMGLFTGAEPKNQIQKLW